MRIERKQTEVHRQAREASTVISRNERAIGNSEILQATEGQPRVTVEAPQLGKILPNQQGQEVRTNVTPKLSEILPRQTNENQPQYATEGIDEIPPKEPNEVTDLVAMEEGARAQTPNKSTYSNLKREGGPQGEENLLKESPQMDTAQHYLDDNSQM